jgi:chemotaxis protein histidine kinase CheA
MTQPLGIDDFFALEAGEYLERLGHLVAGGSAPRPDELVRYARALRGSALMANQHAIARAAGGLEHVVRSYRDGRRVWDMETATLAASAVDELRDLVGRVSRWTADDGTRAERLALRLEGMAGSPSTPGLAATTSDAGVRAFLAREAATVASALDQAARTIRGGAPRIEPMQGVLRRMQPLRGLAALSDFPPLAEILDGVDRTTSSLASAAPELIADLLDAGAHALARAARDVAELGKPDPEAPECRRFAEVLVRAEPPTTAVLPIESLFFDGEPGIVRRGTAPEAAPRVSLSEAELVSRGEHLCQVADELERAGSPTMQSLRLHSIAGALRALSEDVTDAALAEALDGFSTAARGAIAEGAAAQNHRNFAGLLRQVGSRLRASSEAGGMTGLPEAIVAFAASVKSLGAPAAAASRAPEPIAEAPVIPIEALAPDGEEAASEAAAGLIGSLLVYQRLLVVRGLGVPSLEALVAPSAPAPPAAATPSAPAVPEPAVVDIATLCYRGRSALSRAAEVRVEIKAAMSSHAAGAVLRPLVEELLDLVELAQVE